MPTLTIILDTNEYIFGLNKTYQPSVRLLNELSSFKVKIPRLILEELRRNLNQDLLKELYQIINKPNAEIVAKKIPGSFLQQYKKKLPYEDAVIASYCQHLKVDFLISENRHFLIGFKPKTFKVLSAQDFLNKIL